MRCAYCHDDRPDPFLERCPDCDTLIHLDCWDELRRCPTVGCSRRPPLASLWPALLGALLLALFLLGPSTSYASFVSCCSMGLPSRTTSQLLGDGRIRLQTTEWIEGGYATVRVTYRPGVSLETQVLEVDAWEEYLQRQTPLLRRAPPPGHPSALAWIPDERSFAQQRVTPVVQEIEWAPRRRRRIKL